MCRNARQNANPDAAAALQVKARDMGLLFLTAGKKGQVLRTHVPLVISDALLDEGLDIFAEATEAVLKG